MNRREFLGEALARPLAGVALLVVACGGDDGPAGPVIDAPPPSCLQNGTRVLISGNHGHALTVPIADIQAGIDKTYDMGGTDHTHSITITAQQFGQLAGNQPVMARSTVDGGHSHPVSISCQ